MHSSMNSKSVKKMDVDIATIRWIAYLKDCVANELNVQLVKSIFYRGLIESYP